MTVSFLLPFVSILAFTTVKIAFHQNSMSLN